MTEKIKAAQRFAKTLITMSERDGLRMSECDRHIITLHRALLEAQTSAGEEIEGLSEAVSEGEEFEDYIHALKVIVLEHHPKCTCNAGLCEWCIAHIAYDEGSKYLPILHEAARRYAASQQTRGEVAEGDAEDQRMAAAFFENKYRVIERLLDGLPQAKDVPGTVSLNVPIKQIKYLLDFYYTNNNAVPDEPASPTSPVAGKDRRE